ncbi:hypothetical protein ACIBEK_06360 [Nocardia fusca]|uniref:hypothetical protein n=1 Tax=Nocardia fusca TaxID=941183 RepID=UPI0037A6F6AA
MTENTGYILRTEPLPMCRLVHRVFARRPGHDHSETWLGAIHTDGHRWRRIDKAVGLPIDPEYPTAETAAEALAADAAAAWPPRWEQITHRNQHP